MIKNRKVYAVILAAGSGKRMGTTEKKQFLELHGKPLFYYAFEAFSMHPSVDGVVMVTAEEDIPYMRELLLAALEESSHDGAYMMDRMKGFVAGGRERSDSVRNALHYLKTGLRNTDGAEESVVLIHDGARPFIEQSVVDNVLTEAAEHAVIPAVPVKDTVRVVNQEGEVTETPERSSLYAVQTPQGFPLSMLCRAYAGLDEEREAGEGIPVLTDDAMLVERYLKEKLKVVEGSYRNMKITTEEDLLLAELYLRSGSGKQTSCA